MQQASKRHRAIARGCKLTGKRHSHQRQHRAKMHNTRAGWLEHQKRNERRQTEKRRIHKMQNHAWNGG